MAELTNPINKQNVVDRFADYVVATANSGISWGTNAYPFAEWSHAGIFGGGTGGKGIEINGDSIGTNGAGEITAQNIYDTLIQESSRYARIRKITAQLFVDGGGGNTGSRPTPGTVYNETAVAHLTSSYNQSLSADRSDVSGSNTITLNGLQSMFNNMRSAYSSARENNAGTWVTSVCHASCHSSCHSSRGRR